VKGKYKTNREFSIKLTNSNSPIPDKSEKVRICDNVLLDFSVPIAFFTAQPKISSYGYSNVIDKNIDYTIGNEIYERRR